MHTCGVHACVRAFVFVMLVPLNKFHAGPDHDGDTDLNADEDADASLNDLEDLDMHMEDTPGHEQAAKRHGSHVQPGAHHQSLSFMLSPFLGSLIPRVLRQALPRFFETVLRRHGYCFGASMRGHGMNFGANIRGSGAKAGTSMRDHGAAVCSAKLLNSDRRVILGGKLRMVPTRRLLRCVCISKPKCTHTCTY
jgi:hypothetical protein